MRKCIECNSDTSYIDKNGYVKWYRSKDKDGFLCMKCYLILVSNPKHHPKKFMRTGISKMPGYTKMHNDKNHPRRIQFKDRRLMLKENPRIGFCNLCKKFIGDEYVNFRGEIAKIKITHMHHMNYNEDNPLQDTIELCASCHAKVSLNEIEIIVI